MKLSRYHAASRPFTDDRTGRRRRVVFATRTAEARVIDEEAWSLVENRRIDELPMDIIHELIDTELLIPEDEDELETILARNRAEIEDDDNLYIVLQPAAWCQLGCDYCGQKHFHKHLNAADQRKVADRIREKLARKPFQTLELSWFGGEPLTGLKVMRSLTPMLVEAAASYGVAYTAKVVTNGVSLSSTVATELVVELGVGAIEVTIDGDASYHDRRRHTKAGNGTFDKIYGNVVTLARRDDIEVNLTVRCNVDRRNAEGVSPLLRRLAEDGVAERIGFYVAPIHAWGNDAHLKSFSHQEFAELEIGWFAESIELGFRPSLLPRRRPIVCLAVSPDAEVIDANGEIFNCTEVSYVPAYGRPNRFAIGDLQSGVAEEKRLQLGSFNERIGRGEYQCGECPMLPVCGGRCPKLWQEGIVPCPTAKFNIGERLLMKYAMSRIDEDRHAARSASHG
jgi:uncharacterized protein